MAKNFEIRKGAFYAAHERRFHEAFLQAARQRAL